MTSSINPPKGWGLFPWGKSPWGYGQPASINKRKPGTLLKPDGSQGNARLIDQNTRDYVISDDGKFVGTGELQHKVFLALFTIRGSAIVPELGQSFSNIKTITPNLQVKVEDEVRQALSSLIQAGLVSLISVQVASEQNRIQIKITWQDVSNDTEERSIVQI